MTLALLLGAVFGLGLCALVAGLAPRRGSLAQALAAWNHEPQQSLGTPDAEGWAARMGRPAATVLAGFGLPGRALRRDLAILDRPPERLLAEQATVVATGIVLAPATAALLAAAGITVTWQLPAAGALALGAAGFAVPALAVRQEATARRASIRHALAAFLDLAVVAVAGGAGVEAALAYAANVGRGFAFTRLRQALETASLTRRPPWETLRQLGAELGIPELSELAASVTLAGTEGAKVKASLAAKASALRARQLAEAETSAQAATERMSLPLVVLFAGFLALIGFPAVVHIINGI